MGEGMTTYRPGEMLSESALMASGYGQQLGGAPFALASTEANDPGGDSDCSTADTANEAVQMAAMDSLTNGNPYMMPGMGMLADNSWMQYASHNYWIHFN